jgi:hypothetical protein
MRGEQIIIPRELQATVVHLAHEGHLGQDKTLGLLRETCWFPGIGDLVHKFVSTCRPCRAKDQDGAAQAHLAPRWPMAEGAR